MVWGRWWVGGHYEKVARNTCEVRSGSRETRRLSWVCCPFQVLTQKDVTLLFLFSSVFLLDAGQKLVHFSWYYGLLSSFSKTHLLYHIMGCSPVPYLHVCLTQRACMAFSNCSVYLLWGVTEVYSFSGMGFLFQILIKIVFKDQKQQKETFAK